MVTVPQRIPPPDVPIIPHSVVGANSRLGAPQFTRTEITREIEGPTLWSDRFEDSHEPVFSDRVMGEVGVLGPLVPPDFTSPAIFEDLFEVDGSALGSSWFTASPYSADPVSVADGVLTINSGNRIDVLTDPTKSPADGKVTIRFRITVETTSNYFTGSLWLRAPYIDHAYTPGALFIQFNDTRTTDNGIRIQLPGEGAPTGVTLPSNWTMNDWYQFIVEFSDSLVRATLLHEADGLSLVYEKTGDFSASTAPAPIEWYQDGGDDGEIQIDYFRIE